MSNPCEQRDNILGIKQTLEKLEKGQERFIDVLEKIATQGVRILHLEQGLGELKRHHEDDATDIFTRIRSLEQEPAKEHGNMKAIVFSCCVTALLTYVVTVLAK